MSCDCPSITRPNMDFDSAVTFSNTNVLQFSRQHVQCYRHCKKYCENAIIYPLCTCTIISLLGVLTCMFQSFSLSPLIRSCPLIPLPKVYKNIIYFTFTSKQIPSLDFFQMPVAAGNNYDMYVFVTILNQRLKEEKHNLIMEIK